MTANAGEFGTVSEEVTTDELLQQRMAACLGSDATRLFFAELQREENLTRRAWHLLRLAKLLELFGTQPGVATPPAMELATTPRQVNTVQPSHIEEVIDEESVQAENVNVAAHHKEVSDAETPTGHALQSPAHEHDRDDEFKVDSRIESLLESLAGKGITAQLQLMDADRDAVVGALMEIRGTLDSRTDPVQLKALYSATYAGKTVANIAEDFGITISAIYQKYKAFQSKCRRRLKEDGLDAREIIVKHVRPDSQHRTLETAEAYPTENMTSNTPDEVTVAFVPQETHDDPAIDQTALDDNKYEGLDDRFDMLLTRLTAGHDGLAESIQYLLTEETFHEDSMAAGKGLLGELMATYAPNKGEVKKISVRLTMRPIEYCAGSPEKICEVRIVCHAHCRPY